MQSAYNCVANKDLFLCYKDTHTFCRDFSCVSVFTFPVRRTSVLLSLSSVPFTCFGCLFNACIWVAMSPTGPSAMFEALLRHMHKHTEPHTHTHTFTGFIYTNALLFLKTADHKSALKKKKRKKETGNTFVCLCSWLLGYRKHFVLPMMKGSVSC